MSNFWRRTRSAVKVNVDTDVSCKQTTYKTTDELQRLHFGPIGDKAEPAVI
jgi:hypothetical protein